MTNPLRLAPLFALFTLASVVAPARAVLLIGVNGALYKEDFNTLPLTGTVRNAQDDFPTGWDFDETGADQTITFAADNGSNAAANTYSYGSTGNTDRALGEITSPTLFSKFGAGFINRTGFTITRLTLGYTGEQWRSGSTDATVDRLNFQVSLNATNLSNGTWTDVNSLDFVTPAPTAAIGLKNGNNATFRTQFPNVVISSTPIPNLSTFWIRWVSADITGNDDGLAIDDVVLRANPIGDFDLDGDVDGGDFLRWQRNVGKSSGSGISDGDANVDGAVDQLDFAVWRETFGNLAGAAPSIVAAPEPHTAALALLSVCLLGKKRR